MYFSRLLDCFFVRLLFLVLVTDVMVYSVVLTLGSVCAEDYILLCM